MSFGDFTLIIVQVCSPGPITDVVLIIALSGLYWMFDMCGTWASPVTREDFKDQARLCQDSLETVLSTLNFWLPTTRLVNGYSIPNFGYRLGWGRTDRGLGLGLICQTPTQPVPQPRFFTL
jgi:hypothetical protein